MNKDTVSGKFDQAAGKVKEKVGETVGNQKMANAGVADQVKGAAKETWGKTKDTAAEVNDASRIKAQREGTAFNQRTEGTAHNLREDITSTTQNIKNKINNKLDGVKHDHQRHT
jgi:uncharacterized protein YjbJ (UPF0337 family)